MIPEWLASFLPANENGVLNKKMMARGGGRLFQRGACLIYRPKGGGGGEGLTRGRALIRTRALIRGNTLLRNFGGKLWGMRKWQIADRLLLVCSLSTD